MAVSPPRSSSAPWLAATALVGFAANSVLCRKALGSAAIDAATFTAVRLGSGALVLFVLHRRRGRSASTRSVGSWPAAVALFVYAAGFSFAYLRLPAGAGALVLFGAVQLTMVGHTLVRGERPAPLEALGLLVAAAGLVGLAAPGIARPDPIGALLMAAAGAAWGLYSLEGRGARDALGATASNFARALPLALAVLGVVVALGAPLHASPRGVLLAAASGGLASGVGYSLWYAALPRLTATLAAVVQLAVPPLAAVAGFVLLGERLPLRVLVTGAVILAGIALAIVGRRPVRRS